VKLALGLIEHIVAHGKVLLARKNPCSSVGWLLRTFRPAVMME
jgi:hypothetical protein